MGKLTGTTWNHGKPEDSSLREQIASTLQNFAVCREYIGSDEYMKSGDFEAHLLLTFGQRDTSKTPIDDLFDKAVAKITTYIEAAEIALLLSIKSKGTALGLTSQELYLNDAVDKRVKFLQAQKAVLEGHDLRTEYTKAVTEKYRDMTNPPSSPSEYGTGRNK